VEQALPHLRGFAQTLQLGNTEAIKQAAIAGLGLACLSRHALEEPLALGRLRVLETPLPPCSAPCGWYATPASNGCRGCRRCWGRWGSHQIPSRFHPSTLL
jgi:DNA-binding transcriptional LysR family regulator